MIGFLFLETDLIHTCLHTITQSAPSLTKPTILHPFPFPRKVESIQFYHKLRSVGKVSDSTTKLRSAGKTSDQARLAKTALHVNFA